MTPFPYSVDIDARLPAAEELLERHGFHHLPVVKGHELCGVVSSRRIERTRDRAGAQELRVRDVYDAEPYVVGMKEPLDNVVLHMARRHAELAVVARNGIAVGVFTTSDACRYLGEFLREHFLPPEGDTAA